jgi:uncharacterized membrane protein YbhN (UPF0104 family)
VSRLIPLLQRFLLLAILLFAAGFCWSQRALLAGTAQFSLWQWALIVCSYLGCYWLNALMACQLQWARKDTEMSGTQPRLCEMLVINCYASILGYATVLRLGYYSSKTWFYQQRYGLPLTTSLGLQAWVSILVLAGNVLFGLCYGTWMLIATQQSLPLVFWGLMLATLLLLVGVVIALLHLANQSWLPTRVLRWLGNVKAVIASTSWREILTIQAETLILIPLQALAIGVLCYAFNLAIPLPYLLLMALVSNLSLIIALTPANLGIREFVLWQLLAQQDLSNTALLGALMVDRLLQFLLVVIISLVGYRTLQSGMQKKAV